MPLYEFRKIALFLVLSVCAANSVGAQQEGIVVGMTMKEVLTKLGSPQDKSEKETKRIIEWSYPKIVVSFKEDKVISVKTRGVTGSGVASAPQPTKSPTPKSSAPVSVDEILSEIVGAGGGSDDESAMSPPAPLPGVVVPPVGGFPPSP